MKKEGAKVVKETAAEKAERELREEEEWDIECRVQECFDFVNSEAREKSEKEYFAGKSHSILSEVDMYVKDLKKEIAALRRGKVYECLEEVVSWSTFSDILLADTLFRYAGYKPQYLIDKSEFEAYEASDGTALTKGSAEEVVKNLGSGELETITERCFYDDDRKSTYRDAFQSFIRAAAIAAKEAGSEGASKKWLEALYYFRTGKLGSYWRTRQTAADIEKVWDLMQEACALRWVDAEYRKAAGGKKAKRGKTAAGGKKGAR